MGTVDVVTEIDGLAVALRARFMSTLEPQLLGSRDIVNVVLKLTFGRLYGIAPSGRVGRGVSGSRVDTKYVQDQFSVTISKMRTVVRNARRVRMETS